MTPSKIRQKTVAAKAQGIREMLAAITSLPLASAAEFSSDVRMVAAGESFLRRSLEGPWTWATSSKRYWDAGLTWSPGVRSSRPTGSGSRRS